MIIESLPWHAFISAQLDADMIIRQKNGKRDGMKPKTMWIKWGTAQTLLKRVFAVLPDNYHKMAPGTQLYQVHQKVVRDHYRSTFVSAFVCVIFLSIGNDYI